MSQEVADIHFEMRSASRGFHVYRSIPKPRIEEILKMKPEYATIHDPLAIAITASLQETLTKYDVVGHVPREISRFCRYFLNYGGLLEGRVRDVRYRRSPIPKGGLEIPITMLVKRHKASPAVFNKMKKLVLEYYTEPENIKKSKVQSEMEERCATDDLDEFGPADDVEASHQSDAHVDMLEDVICID